MATFTSENGKYKVTLPDTYGENGEVSGKLWEKNGKARVYVKMYSTSCPVDCGYIDLVDGKSYLQSRPVGVARAIESETEIVEMSKEEIIKQSAKKEEVSPEAQPTSVLKKNLYNSYSRQREIMQMLNIDTPCIFREEQEEVWERVDKVSTTEHVEFSDGSYCDFLFVQNVLMGGFGMFSNGVEIDVSQCDMQQVYDGFINSKDKVKHIKNNEDATRN